MTIVDAKKMNRREIRVIPPITTAYHGTTDEVVRALRDIVADLRRAIAELQTRRLQDEEPASDGWPRHGQECPLLGGQFLRLTQPAAAPSLVTVEHGLRRRPQGVLWIKTTGINQALINGDVANNIAPSSSSVVVFKLNGSINEEHICILF